ncbi:hypothetical protein PALI_a0690 [Pseudoalteromonas aliena SW19]|uniref:Uncharacterized protein n=1 Tax=Pseudoalteromonas aliena SW19 TaxID=1314866 RepID=A0ABR9DYL1_9GAMM|nr:hypothetical protein [Pseudoalteromonas aliena SW19]
MLAREAIASNYLPLPNAIFNLKLRAALVTSASCTSTKTPN